MRNNVKTGHKNQQSYANTRTSGKEQYYTNEDVVDICLTEVQKHINLDGKTILEPCGGTGEFIEGFRRLGIPDNKIVSYDIEPFHPIVKQGSYLEQDFSKMGDLVSITNPPFGRMSTLAKKFFAHATTHSEYICYLVPRSMKAII
jgi:predicted RNA methylase